MITPLLRNIAFLLFCVVVHINCALQPPRFGFASFCRPKDAHYNINPFTSEKTGRNVYDPQASNINNLCRLRGGSGSQNGSCRFMLSPTVASVLAGSVAGAIGVGVAFPLDTLKTKSQVLGQKYTDDNGKSLSLGMWPLIQLIYQEEGLIGFYGGVKAMMIGQAFIKALAFSANTFALQILQANMFVTNHFPNLIRLLIAATFSGFMTSFLVAPFERIKVMMQAADAKDGEYGNEIDCMRAVLATEGLIGLMGRGLMPTILREVPSYGIYFVLYGVLMKTPLFIWLGTFAPLVAGAASGCASWLPVYPIDVVKTLIQNTEGGEKENSWKISKQLYADGGIGAFYDGLTPKMLRAAVNHSVTFQLYVMMMSSMSI